MTAVIFPEAEGREGRRNQNHPRRIFQLLLQVLLPSPQAARFFSVESKCSSRKHLVITQGYWIGNQEAALIPSVQRVQPCSLAQTLNHIQDQLGSTQRCLDK